MTQLSNGQRCVVGAVTLTGVSPAEQVSCYLSEWGAFGYKAVVLLPWILLGMARPWVFVWGYLFPIPNNVLTVWSCFVCRMLLISMYKWSKLPGYFSPQTLSIVMLLKKIARFLLCHSCFYFRDKLKVLAFLELLSPYVSVLDACILKRIRLDDY